MDKNHTSSSGQLSHNDLADYWYYEIGATPIPVISQNKNKKDKPLSKVKWKQYQTKELDEKTFESWKKDDLFCDGIAIIGGYVWRGNFKGYYLIMIDIDNKLGIDELFPKGLSRIGEKTLVEQHKDKQDKAHVYFYSKKPIHKKVVSGSEDVQNIPAIEVKSEGGHGIHIVSPSIHADGYPYEIVSISRYPAIVDTLEEQIQKICDKYNIPYLDDMTKFGYQQTNASKYMQPDFKLGENEGRRPALLVMCNHWYWERQENLDDTVYDEVLELAHTWNIQHCTTLLTDSQVEKQANDAIQYSKNLITSGMMYPIQNNTIVTILKNLTDIEDSRHARNMIKTRAVIVSNSIAYNVPKIIRAYCDKEDKTHTCENYVTQDIALLPEQTTEFVDIKLEARHTKTLRMISKYFTPDCHIIKEEIATKTLQLLRIKPIVNILHKHGKETLDGDGNKWSMYDILLEEKNMNTSLMEAGVEVEVTALVMPDPKNQKITLLAKSLHQIDNNQYDIKKILELQKLFSTYNIKENIRWITTNFEIYSKIIKRPNITELAFLTFFSPLYITFAGSTNPNWVKSLVIGDSTTGKSETVRQMIFLLDIGQIVSGEMSSIAGLAGAAIQATGGQWFVEFGVLPLQDKKFLAIDGAHKLGKEQKDKLAEAERNGLVEINKAAKNSALARTRQIKIENPLDEDYTTTISMDSFFYPVHSLKNNYQIQSIARIDLACFVSDDVDSLYRNTVQELKYDTRLENFADLLRFVWSGRYTISFTDEALKEINIQSIILEERFKSEQIPLLSNDTKHKLVKLSSSLACITCSFNDNHDDINTIIITEKHVRYISELYTREYTKAGLADIVKKSKHEKITLESIYYTIQDITKKTSLSTKNIISILTWISESGSFTKEELQEQFNLSRDNQTAPLIGYLINESIIRRNRRLSATKKGITIGRFIVSFDGGDNSILKHLEEIKRQKHKTFHCTDCNSEWYDTEELLEDIIEGHTIGHNIVEK